METNLAMVAGNEILKGFSPVETPTISNCIAIDEEKCNQQIPSNCAEGKGN